MTSNAPSRTDETPLTLSDADITSERAVTRRSLLGALGLSAGVAAAVAFSTSDSAPAADSDKVKDSKSKKAPPKEEADSD